MNNIAKDDMRNSDKIVPCGFCSLMEYLLYMVAGELLQIQYIFRRENQERQNGGKR